MPLSSSSSSSDSQRKQREDEYGRKVPEKKRRPSQGDYMSIHTSHEITEAPQGHLPAVTPSTTGSHRSFAFSSGGASSTSRSREREQDSTSHFDQIPPTQAQSPLADGDERAQQVSQQQQRQSIEQESEALFTAQQDIQRLQAQQGPPHFTQQEQMGQQTHPSQNLTVSRRGGHGQSTAEQQQQEIIKLQEQIAQLRQREQEHQRLLAAATSSDQVNRIDLTQDDTPQSLPHQPMTASVEGQSPIPPITKSAPNAPITIATESQSPTTKASPTSHDSLSRRKAVTKKRKEESAPIINTPPTSVSTAPSALTAKNPRKARKVMPNLSDFYPRNRDDDGVDNPAREFVSVSQHSELDLRDLPLHVRPSRDTSIMGERAEGGGNIAAMEEDEKYDDEDLTLSPRRKRSKKK